MLVATKINIVFDRSFDYETYYKSNSTPHAIADGVKHACYKAKEMHVNINSLAISQVVINEVEYDGKLDIHNARCFEWNSDMKDNLVIEARKHVGKLLNDFHS